MTAARLPLPAAYVDPAFLCCLDHCIGTMDLVKQFERLYGKRLLAHGEEGEASMRAFVAFVHDCVYTRLPDEAIDSLRSDTSKEAADA